MFLGYNLPLLICPFQAKFKTMKLNYKYPTSAQTLNLTDKLRYDFFKILNISALKYLYKYEIT